LIYTPATTASTTAQIRIALNSLASPSSYTGDGTSGLFLWGAQLDPSSTVGEYIPTTSVINSAPRFDHNPTTGESLGLLVEEARTNSIRNNTMVGAVAGTPGTLPTNWSGGAATDLTREVVGTGTENGVAYIDLKYTGTVSASRTQFVFFEPSNQIAASDGQSWAGSAWVKIVAGSLANITSVAIQTDTRDASLVYVSTPFTAAFTPTSAFTRYSGIGAATGATINWIQPFVRFITASSGAIDITLRIGLPQLEQGAFATSVIPTTTAAVTRSADVASITGANFSSWYRQDEGTVFADVAVTQPNTGGNQFVFRTSDNTYNNAIAINIPGQAQLSTALGGTFDGSASSVASLVANVSAKISAAYASNNLGLSLNGATVVADTTATIPTALNRADIGSDHAGANRVKACTIRRLTFFPQRLPNSTLEAITR
jgi:hypothetical protein